jgi:hypothetical protein
MLAAALARSPGVTHPGQVACRQLFERSRSRGAQGADRSDFPKTGIERQITDEEALLWEGNRSPRCHKMQGLVVKGEGRLCVDS